MNDANIAPQSNLGASSHGFFGDLARKLGMTSQQLMMASGIGLVVLIVLVVAGVLLTSQQGEFVVGELKSAPITLSPTAKSFTPGLPASVTFKGHTGGAAVDGFQIFANITGSLPDDLVFTPSSGLTAIGLKSVIATLENTATGKLLKVLIITSDPTAPYTTTTAIDLGTLNFTAAPSGQMTITFDTTLTKITQHETNLNLVSTPGATNYTFGATSSSTATATTTKTATTTATTTKTATTTTAGTSTGKLKISLSANRANSVNLDGYQATVGSKVYVWLDSTTAGPVKFYTSNGQLISTDNASPWDLLGTGADGNALPLNLTIAGTYYVEAQVAGLKVDSATVTIKAATSTITVSSLTTTKTATLSTATTTKTATLSTATTTKTATLTTATTATLPPVTQIVCGLNDVDGNSFLDIVDFADFVKKYNRNCDTIVAAEVQAETAGTADVPVGYEMFWDLWLQNVAQNSNAVDVDIAVTNATVLGFTPETGANFLSPIGLCNTNKDMFTANRVCAAVAKTTTFANDEVVGNVHMKFNVAGTATISRTSKFLYSDGTTTTADPGLIAQIVVGNTTSSGTSSCGHQDGNRDNKVNVIDLSRFAIRYRKVNCQI